MKELLRPFQISFSLHAVFGLTVFTLSSGFIAGSRVKVVDLSLLSDPLAPVSDSAKPGPLKPDIPREKPQAQPAQRQVARSAVTQELAAVPAPEKTPENEHPYTADKEDAAAAYQRARTLYTKEQFSYIRDLIGRKLLYPLIARRMGWSGNVTVSFTIEEDGAASNLKVTASSGYDILDKDALETIKRCSPYPKPPVRADFTIPVSYRLD